jgi:two-component system cell cycle sensor histidine kinase/response regulator CckA
VHSEAEITANKPVILVVDDEQKVCELIARTLQNEGYEAICVTDSDEAFRLAHERGSLDLLITDVVMPKMDGRRLAHWMRGAYPRTSVLFISGYSNKQLCDPKVLSEHAAFLPKPFTCEELVLQVKELLASRDHSHATR